MEVVFWISFITIAYVYAGYPFILALLSRMFGRPVKAGVQEPTVSVVIAAYNEGARIERRIRNCLALDYPREKLQIIVASDGSSDDTAEIASRFAHHRVISARSGRHRGKPGALNCGVRIATGEIVVFADARQAFKKNAIRQLVRNFADPDVGAVTGELVLLDADLSESRSDIGLYWKYEKQIRAMESRYHSVVGATGAIYAIRRSLYRDLPAETLLDDVWTPMRIVMAGKRVIFEPTARAYDIASCCPQAEFARKVRTLAGNYQLLTQIPGAVLPWRNPLAWQFISHKLGRLIVPYALIALLVSNVFVRTGVYGWFLAMQCGWYLCAMAGYLLATHRTATPVSTIEEQKAA